MQNIGIFNRCICSAGLTSWRPWRKEKNEAPLQILIPEQSIFTLKLYNNIAKTGTELQWLSKKYKNLQYLLFTGWQNCFKMSPNKPPTIMTSEPKS